MNPLLLLKKDLFKDLSFLMGGTFIAQLIPILLQPVLKRIFTVEEFGVFDLYFRSVGLLAIVFSLKYEKAIVLSEKKSESASIYLGIIFLGLALFLLTELVLIFLHSIGISPPIFPKQYSLVIFLVPLSALFFSINTASQFMFIRQKRFMASSSLKIYRRGAEGFVQAGSGFFGFFWGLPLGETIGNISAAFVGLFRLSNEVRRNLPQNLIQGIKKAAKKYSEFPKFALGSNLLNTFVLSALTFQIYAKFSIEEVGLAELTQRMLTIPSALIGVSLGQLVLQRFSAAFNNKTSIFKLFKGLLLFSTLIAVPFFIVIFFWGSEIFAWVFGKEWAVSGDYAKSLIFSTSVFFIISPLGQVLIALHRIKLNSLWEIGKFLIITCLFFVKFNSIHDYLKVYNLLLILIYVSYFGIILSTIIKYEKSIS
jgi:O-antigen/teichoic acid export membrane protein